MNTSKLNKLSACHDAIEWVRSQKNPTEAWQNCERGDWMLWLAKKLKVDDRKLTMAKAMCAKQVEHLMKDQRSKDAIQACIDYFNDLISRDQLNAAAYAAYAAYDAADAADDAAAYAAYAAYAADDAAADYAADYAADAADAADAAAYAAAYAYAADDDAYDARINSLKRSADICREYLTEEVLTAYKKLR